MWQPWGESGKIVVINQIASGSYERPPKVANLGNLGEKVATFGRNTGKTSKTSWGAENMGDSKVERHIPFF
jgi:hypothetical protein